MTILRILNRAGAAALIAAVAATLIAALLAAGPAGAVNSPTFRDCALPAGLDPDFVQLSGATPSPDGGSLTVTPTQPSVTVAASESADPGDNAGHDTFSVTVSAPGAATKTVSGAGIGRVVLTVPLSGQAAGGAYTLSWTATFDNGAHPCPGSFTPANPGSTPFVLDVVAGAPPPVATRPVVAGLRQSHVVWREPGRRTRSHGHRPPTGTRFSYQLSEAAGVALRFTQRSHGRSVGRGEISRAGQPGLNTVTFDGRLPGGTRLAPGRYQLVVTATDATGLPSAPRSIGFRIVR